MTSPNPPPVTVTPIDTSGLERAFARFVLTADDPELKAEVAGAVTVLKELATLVPAVVAERDTLRSKLKEAEADRSLQQQAAGYYKRKAAEAEKRAETAELAAREGAELLLERGALLSEKHDLFTANIRHEGRIGDSERENERLKARVEAFDNDGATCEACHEIGASPACAEEQCPKHCPCETCQAKRVDQARREGFEAGKSISASALQAVVIVSKLVGNTYGIPIGVADLIETWGEELKKP